jgi:general secretion pathway protein M
MKDWFDSLQERERIFLIAGAAIVFIALVYGLMWAPLDKNQRQMATSVANWERSLAELRPFKAKIASGGQTVRLPLANATQSPIVIVDQTLRSRGLEQYRRRSQPTSTNGIRVEFENVAFDELVLWLGDLGAQYDMHVQAGSLSNASQAGPGRINASLTLKRGL